MNETIFSTPLFLRTEGILLKVMPDEIICIEADRAYCNVYLEGNRRFNLPHSMGNVLKTLPEGILLTIGRSHSINILHIKEVRQTAVIMDNDRELRLSQKALSELREKLTIIG